MMKETHSEVWEISARLIQMVVNLQTRLRLSRRQNVIYLSFRNLLFQDRVLEMVSLALACFPVWLLLHTDWAIAKCSFSWEVVQFCCDSNGLRKTSYISHEVILHFLPFRSDFFRPES